MKIVSSEYLQNMLCTQIVVFVLFWHSEQFCYTPCSADVASFWKRFTCTWQQFKYLEMFSELIKIFHMCQNHKPLLISKKIQLPLKKTIPVSISLVLRGCWGWGGWSRKRWRLYFVKNFAQASSLPYLSSTTCGEPVQTSAARFYQIESLEIEFKPGSNDWTLSHYSNICTVFPHIVSDLE